MILYSSVGPVARGTVVIEALCNKPEFRRLETLGDYLNLSVYLVLPASLALGFIQALTRISIRDRNKNIF
jgi:hypothetical protein